MIPLYSRCALMFALSLLSSTAGAQGFSSIPDSARLVAADVERFWEVVDRATEGTLAEALQRDYIDRGTPGLEGFIRNRIGSAQALAETYLQRRNRYEEVRATSLRIASAERAIRAPWYAFKYLYPEAVFPAVYFVIGRLNSGGTVSKDGLIIGAEMQHDPENVPHIVAHELIHFQQPEIPDSAQTLLAQSIREGSADFIAELISGSHTNREAHSYARPREKELWTEFQESMLQQDFGGWLYGGDVPENRPNDLGYFFGYRIAESYYEEAENKKIAIRDIIQLRDFNTFLIESRYDP